MFSWLKKFASAVLKPLRVYSRNGRIGDEFLAEVGDKFLWCRDLDKHSCGDLSICVVQANPTLEDHSLIEIGSNATFIGIYDGHGGTEAARFTRDHLFAHLMRIAGENGMVMSEDVLRSAFSATEDGFISLVRATCGIKPTIATVGTCCLVGVVWEGKLYVANLGDSRAVIGRSGRTNRIKAVQMTKDHNASRAEIRREVMSLNPNDSQIVYQKHGIWRIKGIIQVSRSIGDAYMKKPEFSVGPSNQKFYFPGPLLRPAVSPEPALYTRVLESKDKFAVFASDGLFDLMTNQEIVEFVHRNPRHGIARKLMGRAIDGAAKKRDMRYADVMNLEPNVRRFFHDDITIIVIFFDHKLQDTETSVPHISVRGNVDAVGDSMFSLLSGGGRN